MEDSSYICMTDGVSKHRELLGAVFWRDREVVGGAVAGLYVDAGVVGL